MTDAADDLTGDDTELPAGLIETLLDGCHDFIVGQAPVDVQQGAVANFHVAHVFPVGILGQFVGDPGQLVLFLHQLQCDVENPQVIHQALAVIGHLANGPGFLGGVELVAGIEPLGKFNDCLQPKRPIEVNVQIGLGKRMQELKIRMRRRSGTGTSHGIPREGFWKFGSRLT